MSDPTSETRPARDRFGLAAVGAELPTVLEEPAETTVSRRLWPRLLLGAAVLAMLAGAVVGGRAWGRHGLTGTWEVTRSLAGGHRLAAEDLRRVTVSQDPSGLLQASGRAPIGRVLKTAVPAGTLLGSQLLAPGGVVPGPGQVLVGVAVGPGFAPAGLAPGMHVRVLALPARDQLDGRRDQHPAQVDSLGTSPVQRVTAGTGGAVVTLVLPSDEAARVAELSAEGRVALVATGG